MSKDGREMAKTAIDQDLIRELAALLKETDLSEIEFEQDDLRIRVARHIAPQQMVVNAAPHNEQNAAAKPADTAATPPEAAKHPGVVPSPMVGTAYYAPAPGTKPFVNIGDTVSTGQTVMIVEAMKTMNQIPAPRSGKVSAILVDDGQPVEYGEPLLIIE
jgi:acetyl-CoA carboxylase biotin carboxyl carrier protein